jgi:hypothetical protein
VRGNKCKTKVKMNEKWMVKKVPSIWDATLHKIIEIQVFLGKNKEIHNCLGTLLSSFKFRAPCINSLTPLSHVFVFHNMSICQSKFESWSYKMLPKLEKKTALNPKP